MRVATTLMVLMVAAGCRSSVKPPIEGRAEPYGMPQITFASEGLRQSTAVTPPTVQRDDAGNLLFVTVPIRNTTSRAYTIDYKTTFLDRNGGYLSETGWLSVPLEANSPATIQVNSTSPRASDFQMSIRRAK
jgi:hypothetical protein